MTKRIAVVTPVLDDWDAFRVLVPAIVAQFGNTDVELVIVAVDDGSGLRFDLDTMILPKEPCLSEVGIVQLALNLGHQRAIAVGLTEVLVRNDIDAVFVMDCDGEDRPSDLRLLLETSEQNPGDIVLARRAKRSETRVFKAGYRTYRLLFRVLTGQKINFGNFSFLPITAVRRLVYMPELWNNLAAAIIRSRLKRTEVPIDRGSRYAAESKMNLVSLAVHGLTALSVYTDAIFVRVLLGASAVAAMTIVGIFGAITIRLTTGIAIPGWTTTVIGALLIMLMQTIVLVVATTLMLLAGRSTRPIIPVIDAPAFIASRRRRLFAQPTPGAEIG